MERKHVCIFNLPEQAMTGQEGMYAAIGGSVGGVILTVLVIVIIVVMLRRRR